MESASKKELYNLGCLPEMANLTDIMSCHPAAVSRVWLHAPHWVSVHVLHQPQPERGKVVKKTTLWLHFHM